MTADTDFVRYLADKMYHPRSSAHGKRLCTLLLHDLLDLCEPFYYAAQQRQMVYKLNHIIDEGSPTQWNLDLVVGSPATGWQQRLQSDEPILKGEPGEIWLAIDAKTIMTEHGKARRNRQRDLNSLHDILHHKNPKTIVGGLVVINISSRFKSPLRPEITIHRNIEKLVKETIDLFHALPLSKNSPTGTGLDGLGVVVISHTNIHGESSKLIPTDPAPKPSDPLHYISFLQDICNAFAERFSGT